MTSNTPSNPPSSRPMTLRQQLDELFNTLAVLKYTQLTSEQQAEKFDEAKDKVEALCQEIAREAQLKVLRPLLPEMSAEKYGMWVRTEIVQAVRLIEAELTQKPPQKG